MINNIVVSNVNITEDEYRYHGSFKISDSSKAITLDLSDLDDSGKLAEIKDTFQLKESPDEIRKYIIERVMEYAGLTSRDVQGKEYVEKDNMNEKEAYLNRA